MPRIHYIADPTSAVLCGRETTSKTSNMEAVDCKSCLRALEAVEEAALTVEHAEGPIGEGVCLPIEFETEEGSVPLPVLGSGESVPVEGDAVTLTVEPEPLTTSDVVAVFDIPEGPNETTPPMGPISALMPDGTWQDVEDGEWPEEALKLRVRMTREDAQDFDRFKRHPGRRVSLDWRAGSNEIVVSGELPESGLIYLFPGKQLRVSQTTAAPWPVCVERREDDPLTVHVHMLHPSGRISGKVRTADLQDPEMATREHLCMTKLGRQGMPRGRKLGRWLARTVEAV